MRNVLPSEGEPPPDWEAAYQSRFLDHVHTLLELGYYEAIQNGDYSKTNEETVSGYISEAIDDVLDHCTEPWMAFYDVHNEKPVQQTGTKKKSRTREGKKRRKIDLLFVSAETAPRRRFSFEAKRLNDSGSVAAYLGADGIGCFIHGEYGANDSVGGMLGYIQTEDANSWIAKIDRRLKGRESAVALLSDPAWRDSGFTTSGILGKHSIHRRPGKLNPIEIFHSFLDFRKRTN